MSRKFSAGRIALIAASLVLALALVPVALAGKGGRGGSGGGSSSVSLVLLNSTDGLPHFGQQVTFKVSTSASEPGVRLECYQNGVQVLVEWGGFYAGSAWGQLYYLGPSNVWSGGAADCTAKLQTYSSKGMVTVATTSFHVYP
jgi:hypothetical protein